MAFQPFGYRFEIKSTLPPADVKTAIRSRTKSWFDPKSGARGWIVGPFICLWFSAFDRSGPMLFGSIFDDGIGTRLRGRAGSDLNGILMLALVLPPLLILLLLMAAEGSASTRQLAFAAFLFVGGPLAFWWAHEDRRHAEPLVRFLHNVLAEPSGGEHPPTLVSPPSRPLTLVINGAQQKGPSTQESIYQALLATGVDDSVVLAAEDELYIQTLGRDGGFILETRRGNHAGHYIAIRPGDRQAKDGSVFNFEEATAAFVGFASDSPTPAFVECRPLKPST